MIPISFVSGLGFPSPSPAQGESEVRNNHIPAIITYLISTYSSMP
jgi:hypothetical protein